MLESLAALILQKSMGWLVDGLDSKNFDVSLWAGEVVLHNLAVKGDALDGLGLPISVKSGQLASLKLKIPWRSLKTEQVVIEISGLNILAIPQNEFPEEDQEEQKKVQLEKKRASIVAKEKQRQERKKGEKKSVEAGAPPGRIAALITSIVDNCRVEVSDIHIRIEDRSSSDQPFAFGVKLQSIALESVDKLFQVSRDVMNKTADLGIIRKALNMNKLAMYLDPISSSSHHRAASSSSSSSSTALQAKTHHDHVLPPCSLGVKLTFDDTMVGGNGPNLEKFAATPVVNVSLDMPSIGLSLSKVQYCSLINLTSFLSNYTLRFENRQHRPTMSVEDNPKGWWRYVNYFIVIVSSGFLSIIVVICFNCCFQVCADSVLRNIKY